MLFLMTKEAAPMCQTPLQTSQHAAWVPRLSQAEPKDRQPFLSLLFTLCKNYESLYFSGKNRLFHFSETQIIENTEASSLKEPTKTQETPRNPNKIPRGPKPPMTINALSTRPAVPGSSADRIGLRETGVVALNIGSVDGRYSC